MEEERVQLPGFGLPVNYRPHMHFPNAVLHWSGTILTVRELNMMAIMDKITDKPDWDKKVFDDTIVQKWRQEALGTEGMDVSEKMLDWVCTTFLRGVVLYKTLSWHGDLGIDFFKIPRRPCLRALLLFIVLSFVVLPYWRLLLPSFALQSPSLAPLGGHGWA